MKPFCRSVAPALGLAALLLFTGCDWLFPPRYPTTTRAERLPADIAKCTPDDDQHPPILESAEFQEPVPLPAPVSTSGAEDSPFVLPDGNTLYFFFTPDVRVAPDRQLLDEVTGVWVTTRSGDSWTEPERVWLQDPGKLSLDGAVAIDGAEMWFASAREGYTGVNMFIADLVNGAWKNWRYCGDRLMLEIQIGEVHLRGDNLHFHSSRSGGLGGYDIWRTTRAGSTWSDPVNLTPVNSADMDGFPFVSSDGNELWFTRTYLGTPAVYRSVKVGDAWQAPELIVHQFAGEPTLDDAGNLYFVHHFYRDDVMIEADIYLAARRP